MAQTVLTRTPSGAGNRKTWTFSTWIKRAGLGNNIILEANSSGGSSNTNYIGANFGGGYQLVLGGWTSNFLATTQFFRDVAAWYHIVIRVDTTQSTADDRMRIYVNGEQVTDFGTRNNPGQNDDTGLNAAVATTIGKTMDGYMAQTILADGQSLAPTSFGETDSTTGIWKPKAFSGTYGTNGFKLDFKNSGALGTDTSGNTNNFTVTNAGTNAQVVDTPTNNFATMNSIANTTEAGGTFSEGNLKVVTNQADYSYRPSSIGVSAGKWYCEVKAVSFGGGSDPYMIGITSTQPTANSDELGHYANDWAYREDGKYRNNNSNTTWGNTYTSGDIIGIALDLTNSKLYFSKNGTWQESGDPTSGASGTGAISITAVGSTPLENYFFAIGDYDNSGGSTSTFQVNFGNPPFTISSGNADANGFGNFEYAVPSGYYALCTENLNTYG